MVTRASPFRTTEQLYQAADKALSDSFGFQVARNRYNFAGFYEERSSDDSVTVTYMFEVRREDAGAPSTLSSDPLSFQNSRMTNESANTGYPVTSPPHCYTRFDLLHVDNSTSCSDVRQVLVQYFTLCDQLSKDMLVRRCDLISLTGNEPGASLVTYDGSTFDANRTLAHYEEVPPICRNDLGLATSTFFSSCNDVSKTFGLLQVRQPANTPSRNTFWDAEMDCRLSISIVIDN